jgi:hypothetical protein
MFSQITRLELIIVAAVLLLLLWTRAPRSGNAGVRLDAGPTVQDIEPRSPAPAPVESITIPSLDAERPAVDEGRSDPVVEVPVAPVQPKLRRIGVVDARNCSGLGYKEVLYGEVTVRWVWNGQRLVPRKVCVVRESDGVTSVWDFDEHDPDVKISEIQEPIKPQ